MRKCGKTDSQLHSDTRTTIRKKAMMVLWSTRYSPYLQNVTSVMHKVTYEVRVLYITVVIQRFEKGIIYSVVSC